MTDQNEAGTVADAYLALLARRGVQYLFGNAGTDFAPIIEAFARATRSGTPVPQPILASHEHVAVSMAHGYAAVSRQTPAVMVHVSVGTANAVCAAANASRENVPMLLTAGRTPITEFGLQGSRDGYIHWAQEMFDQAGLLREFVKWDYELRNGEQLETVIDRALAIARSEPQGPVYLSLPREVIAAPMPPTKLPTRLNPPAAAAPDPAAIASAAELLRRAKRPLLITASAGRDPAAVSMLDAFAQRFAVPVVQHRPRHLSLASNHPMNLGYDATPFLSEADVVLVLESDVPWLPHRGNPPANCKIIQCGMDPLFGRYPIRGFPCDLGITGSAGAILSSLGAALESGRDAGLIEARAHWVAERRTALVRAWEELRAQASRQIPIHPAWISHCLGRVKGDESIVINEYSLSLEHCGFERPGSYFGSSSASGLGWGAGAALGAKLAAPERPVIAALGDGAYIFSNPVAVHHASAMHRLPVLFVIINNGMWGAVRRSILGMYPEGEAARSNRPPLVHLDALPAFEEVCAAAGGHGERIEDPAALPAALERAMTAVTRDGRQALLNVICAPS